jgi:hypothetical protein
VLYPIPPLYNTTTRELTPPFVRAIHLIFRLVDRNFDFGLSNSEFGSFHSKVYGNSLGWADIEAIKDVIKSTSQQAMTEEGITLTGFTNLQKVLI